MDARRRYLRLQSELGGPEVYVRRAEWTPGQPDGTAGDPVAADPGPQPEPAPRPEAPPAALRAPLAPKAPPAPKSRGWRSGAPGLPGPGIEVLAPAPQLLEAQPDYSSLDAVAEAVSACTRCALCQSRTRTVPGEGSPEARLLCIGEGPGETEDRTGRPFVGRAGELLTDILAAIDLPRAEVFIANVVKCRPPQNRKPLPDEIAACLPYLHAQIRLLRPKVILALGATAAEGLLGTRKSLNDLRGRLHRYDGIPVIVTYHPAALLRNPHWKKPTWDDVRIARQLLDA